MTAAQPLSRIRILAIAGCSLGQSLYSQLSRRLVCDLYVADDWAAGTEKLKTNDYDIVLVEVCADSADELPAIAEIRKIRPDAKVIVLVRASTSRQVIEAMKAEAFSYFSQPFEFGAIREMIQTAAAAPEWSNGIEVTSTDVNYLTLRLSCSLFTADRLVQFMREMEVELSEEERQEVAMAFREVLLNAIEHGGKFNPEEYVRVSRVKTRRTIVYHIQDPGHGFSRGNLPHAAMGDEFDPIAHISVREEAGMRCGGFGMLIATSFVDEVMYNEQGNEVILIKYLS